MRLIRVAEMVANELRSEILAGSPGVGDRLASQEILAKRFDVSLPAIREALGILEMEGLITVRRGNVGGAVVLSPDPERIAYMTAIVLQARSTKLVEVTEALAHFEPLCAVLCAGREDRHKRVVPKLAKVVKVQREHVASDESVLLSESTLRFHEIIIQECGNEAVALTVGSVFALWRAHLESWSATAYDAGEFPDVAVQQAILRAHERILEAIDSGDEAEAHRLATKHATESHSHHHREPSVGPNATVACALLR